MRLEPFLMERFQSVWEHEVEINLAESGVEPLRVRELLSDTGQSEELLDRQLGYAQGNGGTELRERIATLYPGATPDNVLVTTGCAEANFLVTLNRVEAGDEVVMMVPNYMQTRGVARAFQGKVQEWRLRPDGTSRQWRADLEELRRLVGPRTRLILLCSPNNPTGAYLEAEELDEISRIADQHGAWILCDEVYRGAEIEGEEAPSMWGRYDKTLITSGLSKAYGLPGLRIGWIVGPSEQVTSLWSYHDYTTIAPSSLSDFLATIALSPEKRRWLLDRTRGILQTQYPILASWLEEHQDTLTYQPPRAGAITYLRYHHAINSTELVERLRKEQSVLVVPGDHFHMDGYLRLGYGYDRNELREGLRRISEVLASIGPTESRLESNRAERALHRSP